MSIKYHPVKRENPVNRLEPELFYPNPVYIEKINLRKLAKAIALETSLSATDVIAVINAITEKIPFYLTEGAIVSLDEFGSFRITLKGKGATTKAEMTSANITDIRVQFRPGKEFANLISTAELEKRE